jgi:hypothetical protein
MMNAADKAIEEIREVRRRISAGFDHDIAKYLARLQEDQKQHSEQVRRGKELLAQRNAERKEYRNETVAALALRDKPKA